MLQLLACAQEVAESDEPRAPSTGLVPPESHGGYESHHRSLRLEMSYVLGVAQESVKKRDLVLRRLVLQHGRQLPTQVEVLDVHSLHLSQDVLSKEPIRPGGRLARSSFSESVPLVIPGLLLSHEAEDTLACLAEKFTNEA